MVDCGFVVDRGDLIPGGHVVNKENKISVSKFVDKRLRRDAGEIREDKWRISEADLGVNKGCQWLGEVTRAKCSEEWLERLVETLNERMT